MGKFRAEDIPDDSFKELCYAICAQAAVDYKRSLRKGPDSHDGIMQSSVYEDFFRSEYFQELSNYMIDGEEAIKYLRRTRNKNIKVHDERIF